jgi:hypothetical protein
MQLTVEEIPNQTSRELCHMAGAASDVEAESGLGRQLVLIPAAVDRIITAPTPSQRLESKVNSQHIHSPLPTHRSSITTRPFTTARIHRQIPLPVDPQNAALPPSLLASNPSLVSARLARLNEIPRLSQALPHPPNG